jgi:hypothetical protein
VLRALFVALSLVVAGCATPGANQVEVGLASVALVDVEAVSGLGDVLHRVIGLQRLAGAGEPPNQGTLRRLTYRIHGDASIAGRPFGLPFDTTSELPLPRELVLPAR